MGLVATVRQDRDCTGMNHSNLRSAGDRRHPKTRDGGRVIWDEDFTALTPHYKCEGAMSHPTRYSHCPTVASHLSTSVYIPIVLLSLTIVQICFFRELFYAGDSGGCARPVIGVMEHSVLQLFGGLQTPLAGTLPAPPQKMGLNRQDP